MLKRSSKYTKEKIRLKMNNYFVFFLEKSIYVLLKLQ